MQNLYAKHKLIGVYRVGLEGGEEYHFFKPSLVNSISSEHLFVSLRSIQPCLLVNISQLLLCDLPLGLGGPYEEEDEQG